MKLSHLFVFVTLIIFSFIITGCGYSARDNEATGQVKKVRNETPIICPDYISTDISFGIMRNGVGSMSTQDMWMVVTDNRHVELLKKAAETGDLVKITYDDFRFKWCTETQYIKSVEILK